MFCTQCGTPHAGDARFCAQCGRPAASSAPPALAAAAPEPDTVRARPAKGLWNPNAAGLWSVVFTPAFGAYLHALNWRTLGDEKKHATAMQWLWATMGFVSVFALTTLAFDWPPAPLAWGYLLLWYFLQGKPQVDYVEKRFGKKYPHHPWGKVLLMATGSLLVFLFVALFVAGLIGA